MGISPELLGKLVDWFKSPSRWFAVLLLCAALLFLPQTWLQRIGIDTFIKSYRTWIALAGMIAAAVLISEGVASVVKLLSRGYMYRREMSVAKDYLHHLTADEKGILMCFIANDSETDYFDVGDGIVAGLAEKKLIYRSSGVGNYIGGQSVFAFNIQPWVRHYLRDNPTLLQGARKPQARAERLGLWNY